MKMQKMTLLLSSLACFLTCGSPSLDAAHRKSNKPRRQIAEKVPAPQEISVETKTPESPDERNPLITHPANVAALFPKSVEEMEQTFERMQSETRARIESILSIPREKRTFENTVREFDRTYVSFFTPWTIIGTTQMVHPDPLLRAKAKELLEKCAAFVIDQFETNQEIYRAFVSYQTDRAALENLNAERAYYLENSLAFFRRQGLDLEPQAFQQMKELKKELELLTLQFNTHIAQDASSIRVSKDQLAGIDEHFISSLTQEEGFYILPCNYPTKTQVLENCSVETTRRDYYRAFNNRAFPKNLDLLNQIANKRDTLAKLLGYSSYAALDIVSQMAQTPERVDTFLTASTEKYAEKAAAEWTLLLQNPLDSLTLTPEGTLKPWDTAYLSNQYKKHQLHVDDEKIAEYFPMQAVVEGLLAVYGKFFSLHFEVVPGQEFWDPSVQLIAVTQPNQEKTLLGYLLLDLFPRENKYSHACCNSLIPPITFDGGATYQPALAIVITNFSKSTDAKPSLLKHQEVETFFHEFGHAIHALLGRAEMASVAGYNTKTDFVETPSQLLEEWVWDRDVLKIISHHYQTGEPLPDTLIEHIVAAEKFDEGRFFQRQAVLARISLNCFASGQDKDLIQIAKDSYEMGLPIVAYDPESHHLCSFGHLSGYGAKYYSYLWSKELASQLLAYIRTHGGPLDPLLGERYRSCVIGRGGSCDPQQLVADFLHEEPSN